MPRRKVQPVACEPEPVAATPAPKQKRAPTAAQLAARQKFKEKIARAKEIQAQHPDYSWKKCVSEAWK